MSRDADFGQRLKELRLRLPWKQGRPLYIYEVADEMGISTASLSKAENGEVPGAAILFKISRYYKTTVEALLHGAPTADKQPDAIKEQPDYYGRSEERVIEGVKHKITVFGEEELVNKPKASIGQAVDMLDAILSSGDQVLVQAIMANLRAFSSIIETRTQHLVRISKLEEICSHLRDEVAELRNRMDTQKIIEVQKPPGKIVSPSENGGSL